MKRPILYSFRRCPYAIRARLGIAAAGIEVELREILLRDKAPEFLEVSDDATVPVLLFPDGTTLQESLDILRWSWPEEASEAELQLVRETDGEFKKNLDIYKYASHHPERSSSEARANAAVFLQKLDALLEDTPFLYGSSWGFADVGIAPFVRQFAHVDLDWFKTQNWLHLIRWYSDFVTWGGFQDVMQKYPKWQSGDPATIFGTGDKV